ncbi:cyclic AMP-responsive element-binding protein 5-like isoform X2 [Stigmatopora argus]
MNDKQVKPFGCEAPGCSQSFQFEEHLIMHRQKHQMTLRFLSSKTTFTDETPTPTRFLQNCEEVGLFQEIEEEFLQEQEKEKEESKQAVSRNGPSCMNQHQVKGQVHHPPLHHLPPQPQPPPSCSLASRRSISSTQSGSADSRASSALTHSGPVPGPPSSLLQIRNRQRQPLPASLPGTLPDPAMQGASAQHMSMEKQMSCIMGIAGPINNPSCSSPQRSKQMMGQHYQHQHPVMPHVNNPPSSMLEIMSQRHQAPPLQHPHHHHHHHPPHPHPQLTARPLGYQQRCHPTHPPPLGGHPHPSRNTPTHPSPPAHIPRSSPPAPPLTVPAQMSPEMRACHSPHSQHVLQASGHCGRRRRTAEQDPDERRQKFLERNRAAATRCRQKRKVWVSSLEKKAEELTHTNLQLQNEVTSLRSEVGQLKQILLTHKDCPVTARQRETQGYNTAGASPGGSPSPVDSGCHRQAIQHNSITTSSLRSGDPKPGH